MDKILLMYVDDEPSALDALSTDLRCRGYEVVTAQSGEDALGLLNTISPHLFIVDLRMAPMNGFELYREIKRKPQFKDTPTFFLTGIDDSLAKPYSEKLGIDAFLIKPIDLDVLDSLIRKKLNIL